MKTKCFSVRLMSLVSISDKAYKAKAFDGGECILPKSQVFGVDYDVVKSDAYWISEWILKNKDLQYSNKKIGWYNSLTKRIEPAFEITIEKHVPDKKQITNNEPLKQLKR